MFNFLRKKKRKTGSLTIYINQDYGHSTKQVFLDICKALSLENLAKLGVDIDGDVKTTVFETDAGPINIPQGLNTFILDTGFDISLNTYTKSNGFLTTEMRIYQNEDVDLLIQRVPIIYNVLFRTHKLSENCVTMVINVPTNRYTLKYIEEGI